MFAHVLVDLDRELRGSFDVNARFDIALIGLLELPRGPCVALLEVDDRLELGHGMIAAFEGVGVDQAKLLGHDNAAAAGFGLGFVPVLGVRL